MSKSMKQLKQELEADYKVEPTASITTYIRDLYFKAFGTYDEDIYIKSWWDSLENNTEPTPRGDGGSTYYYTLPTDATLPVSDGSATDFYDIIGCKDVDDLAEHWNLKGDEFNCLKAIAGIALGARHPGTDPKRDANKLVHYANRIKNRLDKQ